MELNMNEIQKLNEIEIYNYLLSMIDNIYSMYEYANISSDEYYKIVINEISKSKNSYNNKDRYSIYLKSKIESCIHLYIKKLFKDNDSSIKLINNYINFKYININSYDDAFKFFCDIDKFFDEYNYNISVDMVIDLFNNNIFSKMIKYIYDYNELNILSGEFEKSNDNELLNLFISTYCMLNNIVIRNNFVEDYDFSKLKVNGSVRSYLIEISKKDLLSLDEERELATRIKNGDMEARDIFIERNLKLVVSVAKRYYDNEHNGFTLLDLIQEGNLGLITAVDRFDLSRGCKFSTYAIWWIKQAILRALNNKSRIIRISVNMQNKIKRLKTINELFIEKYNREATIYEVSKIMRLSREEVLNIYRSLRDVSSINDYINDDKDGEIGDFIVDSSINLEDDYINNNLVDVIEDLLSNCNLDEKQLRILRLRFGFDGNDPMTLDEIGKIYGVTRERIRQLEGKALGKIRNSLYIKELAIYMDNSDRAIDYIDKYRNDMRLLKLKKAGIDISDISSIGDEEMKIKKIKSIYEYYFEYSKEEIDSVLSKLCDEDKKYIRLRYGDDLEHPVCGKLTKEEKNKFYSSLLPRIKTLLKKSYGKRDNIIIESVNKEGEGDSRLPDSINKVDNECVESGKNDINKNDCMKILKLLRTPTFNQMIGNLGVKDAIIVSLRLGYVDNKFFSASSIAKFLEINVKEVDESINKFLSLYKDNLGNSLDDIIDNKENIYVRTLNKKSTN